MQKSNLTDLAFPSEQLRIYNLLPRKKNIACSDEIRINKAAIICLCYILLKINSRTLCSRPAFHLMWELLTKQDKCIVVNSPRGVGNYYQLHHWKWDAEVMRLPLKSQRNPRLSGAAPVAPELGRAEATGEFAVTSLQTGFLSFLLNLCNGKRGKEEEVE